jgi:hypothetical protein
MGSVSLVEETRKTLLHNVVLSTPRLSEKSSAKLIEIGSLQRKTMSINLLRIEIY